MSNFLTGKKTIIFNVAMALVLVYNSFTPDAAVSEEEVHGFIDQVVEHLDAVILIVGNVVLRFMSKGPQTVIK